MTSRTGLGLVVLTLGVSLAGVAGAAEPGEEADQKAKEPAIEQAKADEQPEATAKAKKAKDDEEQQVAQNRTRRDATGQSADDAEEEEPEERPLPARVPWRGTAFSWNHEVTTGAVGVGEDFQSSSYQSYTQTYALGLNYFVVDQDSYSVAIATSPSVSVELTNSDVTTKRNEPWFNDLPLSGVLRWRWIPKDIPTATGVVLNGTLLFPTSPPSANNGTYLTTSPRAVVWQSIPLIPDDVAPLLNSIVLGGVFRWDHRFGAATTAVNDDLQRTRQNATGVTFLSDQLAFNRFAENTLRETIFFFYSDTIYGTQLNISGGWTFIQSFQPDFPNNDCVVETDTGCVSSEETRIPDGRNTHYGYAFGVGASYFPMAEWGISVGYASLAGNQLGPDGRRQNVFYNPRGSAFSAGLVLSIDAIYEAATGARRGSPFVLVAGNEKRKKKEDRKGPNMPITF